MPESQVSWECPICDSHFQSDGKLSSHIASMAAAYSDTHEKWAEHREPGVSGEWLGTAASKLRPFVKSELSPPSQHPTQSGDDKLEEWADMIGGLSAGYSQVAEIEITLFRFIIRRLISEYGDGELNTSPEWWTKGVKQTIREQCAQRAEADDNRYERWRYLDLISLKQIVENKWAILGPAFEANPKFPGKAQLLKSFHNLNELRNKVMHPVKTNGIEAEDFELLAGFLRLLDSLSFQPEDAAINEATRTLPISLEPPALTEGAGGGIVSQVDGDS